MNAAKGSSLLKAAQTGDFQAFAKLLTWLENAHMVDALALEELYQPRHAAFRLGITGPPGAGKSTLVSQLIGEMSVRGLKVGVLAVDPSSPFTRGAILGDRIRYVDHTLKQNVFIRSLGTRGSLGGLSGAAFAMSRAFDVCGFDVLLIETVGVGQTELDVLHVADQVCVVLVPESGDSIQAMKAGLMEIADVFIVNKADRPGAEALAKEIEAAIHDGDSSKASSQVFRCVATEGKGVKELCAHIDQQRASLSPLKNRSSLERLRQEALAFMRRQAEEQIQQRIGQVHSLNDLSRLLKKAETVSSRESN